MQNNETIGAGLRLSLVAIAAGAISLGSLGALTSVDPADGTARPRTAWVAKPPATATAPSRRTRPSDRMARRDLECIASTIWHEAGNQVREGKIAVAEVVMQRTRTPGFPSRPCAVVLQPHQFSFVVGGHVPQVPAKRHADMLAIARGVVDGRLASRVRGALHFHASYVNPGWRTAFVGRIGEHLFYAGGAGRVGRI